MTNGPGDVAFLSVRTAREIQSVPGFSANGDTPGLTGPIPPGVESPGVIPLEDVSPGVCVSHLSPAAVRGYPGALRTAGNERETQKPLRQDLVGVKVLSNMSPLESIGPPPHRVRCLIRVCNLLPCPGPVTPLSWKAHTDNRFREDRDLRTLPWCRMMSPDGGEVDYPHSLTSLSRKPDVDASPPVPPVFLARPECGDTSWTTSPGATATRGDSHTGGDTESSSQRKYSPGPSILHRRKPRKHVAIADDPISSGSPQYPGDDPIPGGHEVPPEEGGVVARTKVRYDKSGKPTRRYLAAEIERLFNKNLQLAQQLKNKEDVESNLVDTKNRLEAEADCLRRRLDAAARSTVGESALKQRNRQLAQDVFLMKNILVRLNTELEKCQDRLRSVAAGGGVCKGDDPPTISEDSGIGENTRHGDPKSKWLKDGEVGALSALLEAYDESLTEKESLTQDYRAQLERLAGRAKELVVENEDLRNRLEDLDRKVVFQGEVNYADWLGLQKELATVREQNELLVRQTKLGKTKFDELRTAFQTKLNECCMERDDALEKCAAVRTELFLLRGRASALQEEFDRLKEQSDSRIPQAVHMASINECKRLFEELKLRYDAERDSLLKRIAAVEAHGSDSTEKMSAIKAERDTLAERIRNLEYNNRKLEAKLDESTKALAESDRAKEDLRRQMSGSVTFSAELLAEQERLLRQLGERTEEALMAGNLASRLDSIKSQIQVRVRARKVQETGLFCLGVRMGVEKQVSEQMSSLDQELRAKANSLQRLREEQSREVERLRRLVTEKEAVIERLEQEKRKVQEELDIVWKAATASEEA
ncbi:hypothetical protein AAG570_007183 [Ranatra chinensis]|uniref:Uncharacterized protein n=1 Tax=Ranatra chinensis TaxID=642074 RepID=A0ABD0XWC3_9HEMI